MAADDTPIPTGQVTQLLHAARNGDRDALDRLVPLVYDQLRALARRQLAREYRGVRTLQPTDLVHEAWIKLARGGASDASDRAHFLAIAARAMRQVMVDQARRRLADKRGGGWDHATLTDGLAPDIRPADLLELDDALENLDTRQRQVVEYRFFAGMSEAETAEVLGVSERTVRRDWVTARARLYRELYGREEGT